MRYLFLILSFTTMLSATQPVWDAVCKIMVANCTGQTCTPQEEDNGPENPNRQCCPSFQCCFLAFAGFSTPYTIDFQEFTLKKMRPYERADVLFSSFTSDCFHPPDAAFFTA